MGKAFTYSKLYRSVMKERTASKPPTPQTLDTFLKSKIRSMQLRKEVQISTILHPDFRKIPSFPTAIFTTRVGQDFFRSLLDAPYGLHPEDIFKHPSLYVIKAVFAKFVRNRGWKIETGIVVDFDGLKGRLNSGGEMICMHRNSMEIANRQIITKGLEVYFVLTEGCYSQKEAILVRTQMLRYLPTDDIHETIKQRESIKVRLEEQQLTQKLSFNLNRGAEGCQVHHTMMQHLIKSQDDGILIPYSHSRTYSDSIVAIGGMQIPYFIDEPNNVWEMEFQLKKQLKSAEFDGICARGLITINNPAEQMNEDSMFYIVDFCHRECMLLLVDEVYKEKENNLTFSSFKNIMKDMKMEHVCFGSFANVEVNGYGSRIAKQIEVFVLSNEE